MSSHFSKPSDIYFSLFKKKHLKHDIGQIYVLNALDHLAQKIYARQSLLKRWGKTDESYLGTYLWGGVGIGKTFLMDCFYNSLTTKKKLRIHFHSFMQEVHSQLQQYTGHPDPLKLVVKSLHKKIDVLCLDEFFVADIVDAMLLTGLLNTLFKEGIYFITTSNISPGDLYKNGLRRDSFLPAIALLQQHLHIIHLDSTTDYRFDSFSPSFCAYYTPLGETSEASMQRIFDSYTNNDVSNENYILLERSVSVIRRCKNAIWFHFDVLCGKMRCKQDYLELTDKFSLVFLSNVPILTLCSLDEVLRFIQLIDILYDAKIKLVISAEVKPEELYTQGNFVFEFQRTISRLVEMQSPSYSK